MGGSQLQRLNRDLRHYSGRRNLKPIDQGQCRRRHLDTVAPQMHPRTTKIACAQHQQGPTPTPPSESLRSIKPPKLPKIAPLHACVAHITAPLWEPVAAFITVQWLGYMMTGRLVLIDQVELMLYRLNAFCIRARILDDQGHAIAQAKVGVRHAYHIDLHVTGTDGFTPTIYPLEHEWGVGSKPVPGQAIHLVASAPGYEDASLTIPAGQPRTTRILTVQLQRRPETPA